ncbi:MAG: HD domain-containing protein [Oscillospiraceae bacterium]|nr:HD domain-containing protein [Oscillospiraceae bacterium]
MKNKGCIRLMLLMLAAALLPITGVYAQENTRHDLLGENTVYTSILYDSLNGLPTSEANAIAQSEDGFIWIGGYSGLTKYDGTDFDHFDPSFGVSSVFSLCVDSSDRLWIGTNENGVACFDHGDMKVYGRVEGMKSYSVRSIAEDGAGNIIIATTQGLAYVGLDMEVHLIDDPQVNMEYITSLKSDSFGRIYGLTLDGAVFELEDLHITAYYDPSVFHEDSIIYSIYPDPDEQGILYMGTEGSKIIRADMNSGVKILFEKDTPGLTTIKAFLENKGLLWIAASNGLGYLDEKGEYYHVSDVPMDNSIGNIMADHEGNIWLTSTRQGVMKLVPDRFTDINKIAKLNDVVVNSTCINSGLLYLGTDEGLTVLDKNTYSRVENSLTQLLSGVRIRCIKNDSKGNLWVCTHGETGLVCYEPDSDTYTIYNTASGLDSSKVRTVLELSDGSMAAATANGLYIIDKGEVTAHYGHENGISTTEILCVAQADSGELYLGSDGDGIYIISGSKVRRLGFDDGLTSGVVMQIKRDESTGVFWLITSNSIEYMKDGTITQVTNFPYSNNLDMYFDGFGNAWVLSSNGIYIVRTEDLYGTGELGYTFYNTKGGLPHIPTGNSRSFLDEDGHLYIAGTTGCCMVDIDASLDELEEIKLIVPTVEVDDKTVAVSRDKTLSLPAGSRKLTIDMYAVSFALNNPRVRYYLEGFDQHPVTTTKQDLHPATYTNLSGGRYIFHLELLDEHTGQVAKSTEVVIIKESSLYESPVFWVTVAAVLIIATSIVMWLSFRRKTKALMAQQEEDRLFITQIMETFASAVDMRDTMNQGHSFRVAYYTRLLAQKLAWKRGYTEEKIHEYYNIALLHDIGKIAIPDAVLNKPGRLDDEEFAIMKSHAAKGEEFLQNVTGVDDLALGAGCHHERIDGKGYPRGLKGEEIPDVARVIAVADTFDAMYSTRPYRKQMPLEDVIAELKRISGTQLESEVVDAMIELYEEGELDKEKVNAAVFGKRNMAQDSGEQRRSKAKKLQEDNLKFIQSLGLDAGEEDKDK